DPQLPLAFCLPSTESVSRQHMIVTSPNSVSAFLPVLNCDIRPIGYMDVVALRQKWEAGTASPNDSISKYMTKFNHSASQHYILITPLMPLAQLAEFFR
ncbi:hypothetical protein DFJ58DRAFT_646650, partial [Suillus subalutaceus]|uniref:uncharacterized protein n=1 Tax=Suillus subalutaceus TaxID=48586 RepID=UPI001B885799